jgi:hypothetical protein
LKDITRTAKSAYPNLPNSNGVTLEDRVKRWYYFALAAAAVAGAAYVHWQSDGLNLGELSHLWRASAFSDRISPGRTKAGWQTVARPDDGFSVDLPADPKDLQVPAFNEVGGAEPVHMLVASRDGETTFAVTWQDNPPIMRINNQAPERILSMARDGMLARTQTTILGESRSLQHGNQSLDVSARNAQGGVLRARLTLSGTRLYVLMALFPSGGGVRDADVSRFFDSFIPSAAAIPETLPSGSR